MHGPDGPHHPVVQRVVGRQGSVVRNHAVPDYPLELGPRRQLQAEAHALPQAPPVLGILEVVVVEKRLVPRVRGLER